MLFLVHMGRKKNRNIVGFISLGCPKNAVDSERMLAEIAQAGFVITPESYNADVIVINTCAFIAPAQAESFDAIKDAVACKADPKQRVRKVVVAGCLTERLGQKLFQEIDGIDAVKLCQTEQVTVFMWQGTACQTGAGTARNNRYPVL